MAFVIKAEVADPQAEAFDFPAQKTMYGGRRIAVGDTVYVFASETQGGAGLVARGVVSFAEPTPRVAGLDRQTPRVSIRVGRTAVARRPLGRRELRAFNVWSDGRPQTELNFKFYRQATNKIGGVTDEAAACLDDFF
jgi:hypothetical protein